VSYSTQVCFIITVDRFCDHTKKPLTTRQQGLKTGMLLGPPVRMHNTTAAVARRAPKDYYIDIFTTQ
jgi:hypothetical protein